MLIEEALYGELSTDSGVAALASTRGYPLVIPQDATLPAWAYQRIYGPRVLTHEGPSGLAKARIQITAIAATYDGAKDLAAAIRAALDGFAGMLGGTGGVAVKYCHVDNEFDGFGQVTGIETVRLDVDFLYVEA